ncbi:MAG: hypothetical protein UX07_C0001G0017 [Parcubacteria group bacterium GW2011_GWA2_45_30]|nr:MAG: hypothetical protein UX07_C0001G0017 [Parcubacteria group bacterium GW2011_GWA2_45_30]
MTKLLKFCCFLLLISICWTSWEVLLDETLKTHVISEKILNLLYIQVGELILLLGCSIFCDLYSDSRKYICTSLLILGFAVVLSITFPAFIAVLFIPPLSYLPWHIVTLRALALTMFLLGGIGTLGMVTIFSYRFDPIILKYVWGMKPGPWHKERFMNKF